MHELDISLMKLAKEAYNHKPDRVIRILAMQYEAATALSEVRKHYGLIARQRRKKLKDYLEGKEVFCEGV